MAQPMDAVAAHAAADAYFASLSRIIDLAPNMYMRQGADGSRLMFTGMPSDAANQVFVAPEPDMDVVCAFAEEMSAEEAPWAFVVRGDVSPAMLRLAARYGQTPAFSLPHLLWDAGLRSSPSKPILSGATVRELSRDESELYGRALVDIFEMPLEVARFQARTEVFDAPGITAFVVEVAGAPVGAGFNVLVDDYVALTSGGVMPAYRRRGYYRALVTARLRHAVNAGARFAIARNTPMSQPLFESLGFRSVESWTYFRADQ